MPKYLIDIEDPEQLPGVILRDAVMLPEPTATETLAPDVACMTIATLSASDFTTGAAAFIHAKEIAKAALPKIDGPALELATHLTPDIRICAECGHSFDVACGLFLLDGKPHCPECTAVLMGELMLAPDEPPYDCKCDPRNEERFDGHGEQYEDAALRDDVVGECHTKWCDCEKDPGPEPAFDLRSFERLARFVTEFVQAAFPDFYQGEEDVD